MGLIQATLNIDRYLTNLGLLMSGLTKKVVYTDETLATILGVKVGTIVSYSELMKGLHAYIKKKNLKNPKLAAVITPLQPPVRTVPTTPPSPASMTCKDCGEPIPPGAAYCDMCGVKQ